MHIEFDKVRQGYIAEFSKNEELDAICWLCGKKIENIPFFICETTKRVSHISCELHYLSKSCKCGDEHFRIIEIKGNTQLNNIGGNTNGKPKNNKR